MTGLVLAQYRIDAELGRGGMGIVYRATDTKLDRTVALKVLPAAALASEDDRARFYREAKAAAQLHHPNIASIFQIDEAIPVDVDGNQVGATDGPRPFIAMEYVEGETLSDHIRKGPLKLAEAVNITMMVAEALRAAHAKDIVHRDIKSANVMLTKEGIAKVLDFGLAKTNASTQLTRQGSTVGTIAYMSPEQARGEEVDGRSDLYSLGTVLYEMVAGRLPFAGDYEQAVVYGILNENPEPLTAVRTGVPMGLEWIVNKLLAKEPRHRYQTAADLVADLETVDLSGSGLSRRSMTVATGTAAAAPSKGVLPMWGWGLVAAALVSGAAAGWFLASSGESAPRGPVREVQLQLGPGTDIAVPVVAPDGRFLTYFVTDSTGTGVYLYRFDGRPPERLPMEVNGWSLWVSDDSRTIIASDPLQAYSLETNSVVTLIPGSTRAYGILRPDRPEFIITGNAGVLLSKQVGETDARPVTRLEEGEFSHSRHSLLPDGRGLMTRWKAPDYDSTAIQIVDFDTGDRITVMEPGLNPRYLASGHILFNRGTDLRAYVQPIDLDSGRLTGPAKDLGPGFQGRSISVDATGTAFVGPARGAESSQYSVFVRNADGQGGLLPMRATSRSVAVSRDGRRLAFVDIDAGRMAGTISVYQADEATPSHTFPTDAGIVTPIALSADGTRLAYLAGPRTKRETILRVLDTGEEVRLDLGELLSIQWVSNQVIVFVRWDVRSSTSVVILRDLETDTEREVHVFEGRGIVGCDPSPGGAWIACAHNARILLLSTKVDMEPREVGPGIGPAWNPDGKSIWIFGIRRTGAAYYPVDVTDSSIIAIRPLQTLRFSETVRVVPVDGDRLYLFGSVDSSSDGPDVVMIENWLDEVRRIAPTGS